MGLSSVVYLQNRPFGLSKAQLITSFPNEPVSGNVFVRASSEVCIVIKVTKALLGYHPAPPVGEKSAKRVCG